MKNHLVRKSNFLVEASYKLSAVEQKIVLILASMIKPDDHEFKRYVFQLKNIFAFLGLSSNNAYAYMKDVTKSLLGKVFTIQLPDSLLQTHWISSAHYYEGEGTVELCFDPQLKPFLLQLKERFTTYKLREVVQLKSSFSIRMYELLKQYEKIGSRIFEIQNLRGLLGIEASQYRLYADFKKRIILVAQEELAEKSDISFSFEEIKVGHSVGKIKINISKKSREEPVIPDVLSSDFPFPENMKSAIALESAELLKLYELIPALFRDKESVKKAVKAAFNEQGFDFVMRNIVYANEKSNAVKPGVNLGKGSNYRVYLTKALHEDYGLAYQEDLVSRKEAQETHHKAATEAAKRKNQEAATIRIEQEDREKARAFMKSFAQETLKNFEQEAQKRLSPEALKRYQRGDVIGIFEFKRKMENVVMEHMGIRKSPAAEPHAEEAGGQPGPTSENRE